MEYIPKVFISQTSCTDGCRRPVCRFNKQCALLNLDVSEFVEQSEIVEVETIRHQQCKLPGIMKGTQRRIWKDEHGIVKKYIQRIIAPQSKSRCDKDGARRSGVHQDGDYKTHNTGLIRWFQNQDKTGWILPKERNIRPASGQ